MSEPIKPHQILSGFSDALKKTGFVTSRDEGNAVRAMYYLTDGKEIFQSRRMTEAEAKEANELALHHTDGNILWTL
jgi:hypothetical protein